MNKYIKYIIIFLVFIIVFVIYFFVVNRFYPDMATRGQFGDMFGGINALFSGLAFLGVVYAIILQREELKLQRKELELTREELTRTAKAQEKSEKALVRQAASLKATAKLNGLSAMLRHQDALMEVVGIGKYGVSGIDATLKEKADKIIEEIENIIEDK